MNRNLIVERGEDGMTAKAEYNETVIKEFPQIGKYRIRVVIGNGQSPVPKVDIREWQDTGKYKGWTRKGIRFVKAELQQLFKMMGDIGHLLGNGEAKA